MGRLLVTSVVFLWAILSMCCGYKIARSTTCDIINDRDKEECGYFGIDEQSCLSSGCCWNPEVDTPNVPWCYKQAEVSTQCDATYDDSCYKIFSDNLHFWNEARLACGEWGGYLLEITRPLEQLAVLQMLNKWRKNNDAKQMWIGANDKDKEGTFVWANSKEKLSYTNWFDYEPNNSRGKEDCTSIFTSDEFRFASWNDYPCAECGLPYICEKSQID